jgi:hypothetical protein
VAERKLIPNALIETMATEESLFQRQHWSLELYKNAKKK